MDGTFAHHYGTLIAVILLAILGGIAYFYILKQAAEDLNRKKPEEGHAGQGDDPLGCEITLAEEPVLLSCQDADSGNDAPDCKSRTDQYSQVTPQDFPLTPKITAELLDRYLTDPAYSYLPQNIHYFSYIDKKRNT